MARPKRSLQAEAPKARRKRIALNFGKHRPKEWAGPKKGYASLAHGSGKRQAASMGREYLTSRKDRRGRKEAAMGKHASGMLLMLDKKSRKKDAKKAVKQVCQNTAGKARRKLNLEANTRKARKDAVGRKNYQAVCHRRKKKGVTEHRVLPRKIRAVNNGRRGDK